MTQILFCKRKKVASRFIFKFSDGEPISEIYTVKPGLDKNIEENREGNMAKVESSREKRSALVKVFQDAELRVIDKTYTEGVDDLFDMDDAGKLIETTLKIEARNADQVEQAVRLCKKYKLMAMPIGAKTSALGVFDGAIENARKNGLQGVVGIQMSDVAYEDHLEQDVKLHNRWLKIPEFDKTKYDLVKHHSCPVAILKSKEFPQNQKLPHRVIAGSGVHLEDVNKFLSQILGTTDYKYRLMPDPTSKKEAQIGGVVGTGAEGGNRAKAEDDIISAAIVNADGEQKTLEGNDAKNIVGLNGSAGIITQAEFEVTAYPKHEHGMFIPLKGKGKDAWINALKVQAKLKAYCGNSNDGRLQNGVGPNNVVVTSIEPLSPTAIEIAIHGKKDAWSKKLQRIVGLDQDKPSCEMGLYVTFSSSKALDNTDILEDQIYQSLGLDFEKEGPNDSIPASDGHADAYENIYVFVDKKELGAMDELRHGAPQFSRERAKRLGGVTESTDINIRFTSENEAENAQAQAQVAGIYHAYADSFKAEDGFQVATYGHMHPGVGKGGGMDPHIRVIFELSNPGSRYNAPEQVAAMKKKQIDLYRKLMALDGKMGIQILSPEKSRFTNETYWNWYLLHYPDDARKYIKQIIEHGYSTGDNGQKEYPIIGARIPHILPGILPRVPGGIKALLNQELIKSGGAENMGALHPLLQEYWPAILEMCQLSHRGADIKRIVAEVCALMHEKLHLSEDQYPFFIECPEEAEEIMKRNFNEKSDRYNIKHVNLTSFENLDVKEFQEKDTVYVVNITGLGAPKGISIMITPHSAIKDAYQGMVDGTNKSAFRNLYSMWERWPSETDETPNLPAIMSLGLLLDEDNLSRQKATKRENPIVTANPGPAQVHQAVMEKAQEILQCVDAISPERQKVIIKELKHFLGIPKAHSLAFFTSATQIMQILTDALSSAENVNVVQVTNDAFSERLNAVISSKIKNITHITTAWSASEHSELNSVAEKISNSIKANPDKKTILVVTPHKTSTSADFHPDHLRDRLSALGYTMGRDYDMICDVTSGVGARDYATNSDVDTGDARIGFTGMFASVQKAMGQTPGLSFVSLSPQLQELLTSNQSGEFNLKTRIMDAENGDIVNPVALAMLGIKLDDEKFKGQTPKEIQAETRKKAHLVMAWAQRHPDLMTVVQNGLDQSPLLISLFSQSKNLVVAKRLLENIFGLIIGDGYGAYSKEAIRLYLPNLHYEQLQEMLSALDVVLELDDVVKTRGEKIPNIALREPHDPLSVISRLSESFKVDDLFIEKGSLEWLHRLIVTYNANVNTDQRKMSDGKIPRTSPGHADKAEIYGKEDNLEEMKKILEVKDEQGFTVMQHYTGYKGIEKRILKLMRTAPDAVYEEGESEGETSTTMRYLVGQAQVHLAAIAKLLRKYVEGDNGHSARRDKHGRVSWPILA